MNLEFNVANNSWDSSDRLGQLDRCKQCFTSKKVMVFSVGLLGLAICMCLLGYMLCSYPPEPDVVRTLKFTSVIFRHGARTPVSTYNSDPHKNYSWPGGLGSLTNEGKVQLYNLGLMLRKQYSGFLPLEYLERDLYVVSSDAPRTISSASCLLAGLYPPGPRQRWHPKIPWQPIPVHTIPRNMDKMIAIKAPCKKRTIEYEASKRRPEIAEKYQSLYDDLTLHCNQTIQDVLTVELLYSALSIERDNGLQLPAWTEDLLPAMVEATCASFTAFAYDTSLKRLQGGPLLSDILTNMKKKDDGLLVPDRKMFLYSGHDLTIATMWRTLGFEECLLPEYGAAMIIELHSIPETEVSEVKLLYSNNTKVQPQELQIPNCAKPCTLADFVNVTMDVIPIDWEVECQNKNDTCV